MKRSRLFSYVLVISAALVLLLTAAPVATQAASDPSPEQVVQRAWRLAQQSGAYRFNTRLVQTTHPAPSLSNVGRSSREEVVYLEGETDLLEETLLLTLWQDGGSVLNLRRDSKL